MDLPSNLAALVVEAHGGLTRWNEIASIDVTFNLSGAALLRKGYKAGRFHLRASIDAKNTKVVYQGLGNRDPDDRLIYTPGRVWIERRDGTVIASRDNPYAAFAKHDQFTPWDDLHLTCFTGYAIHNYLTFPFHLTWPGFSSRELAPHNENGETWRVLEVKYPDYYPAHTKTQLFYFDQDFMLRRNDHSPLAFKLPSSHYSFDARDINGIKIPTIRRVVRRKPDSPMVDGEYALGGRTMLNGTTSFLLDFVKVVVRDEDENRSGIAKM